MNLYFRFFWTVLASLFAKPARVAETEVLRFRTWPNDLDLNLHMNNGRYLTLMDLGRFQFIIRTGLFGPILRNRWQPVVGEVHFRFRRPLAPFQKFELHTKLASWDEKWVYFEQSFHSRGELIGVGHAKAVIRRGKGYVPVAELMKISGQKVGTPPPVPVMFERNNA